ncbi:MAG: cytochrome-c peroxidase [Salibacteraceae bacterium]
MNQIVVFFNGMVIILLMGLSSCNTNSDIIPVMPYQETPLGFPDMVYPEGNEYSEARWVLGKKLFFDPVLSRDSTISCSSCHLPRLAFSDGKITSPGIDNRPGNRNTPSLANVGYYPYLLTEGGVPTLEMQVLVPIAEHNEFDYNIVDLSLKLRKDEEYVEMALNAYQREIDPFVITRAISTFERSLISGNSRYDKYVNGNKSSLTSQEVKGMQLFYSEQTNCASCHSGIFFTDHSFQNNGLYTSYLDSGRIRLTGLEEDRDMFKVPSLRNVGLTAPYMHDGKFETLMDVINHYNEGGKNHLNKSKKIKPLNLNTIEKKSLEAFLNSLSDFTFINDQRWR